MNFGVCLVCVVLGQVTSAGRPILPDGQVSARSFVDPSQLVSKYTTELYAHQIAMRIVKEIGYMAYQEMYVCYSTGRRRLTPRFGTSEIVFCKLRREFFIGPALPGEQESAE